MGTLELLAVLNPVRCQAFGHSVESMHVTFWTTAIAGETGELCNWVKKMVRGDKIDKKDIEKECADIVIYLDLFCKHQGINLCEVIKAKFNEVSDQIGSGVKF